MVYTSNPLRSPLRSPLKSPLKSFLRSLLRSPLRSPLSLKCHIENQRSQSSCGLEKSTMESPFYNRKLKLEPKTETDDKQRSPFLNSRSPTKARSTSPIKPGFTIFEDEVYYRDTMDFEEIQSTPVADKENDGKITQKTHKNNQYNKENVLQPLAKNSHEIQKRKNSTRKPLGPLSICDFPGHIRTSSSSMQLKEVYCPPNFSNEQKSTHRFNKIPCYVTPSRRNNKHDYIVSKYLVKSYDEDEDEVERTLESKCKLFGRTRSYSVGKNALKRPLIKKNEFSILTN